ncbi:MAG: NADH-quinone oxidoreductase subunit NuoK [Thermoguttaceae bacterium]|nr:NADH-quinone oxidoreductase subunit NuoK [Thermoguttaceae bacterium]MDW8079609.1 NADH-quinone oxidoreductase subunit NuoK [Thermoguttaceae bacterium]
MNESSILVHYLAVGALLVGVGLVGFLARRNVILMFLSVEMMLQGVAVSLAGWSRFHNDFSGQIFVLFTIAVAAAEAAIALALVVMLFRDSGTLDVLAWTQLREPGLPAPKLEPDMPRPPEVSESQQVWPRLAPAGRKPVRPAEAEDYRPTV